MSSLPQIKLIALGLAAAVLIYLTVQYERGQFALSENKNLRADITAGNEGNADSAAIGKSLNDKEAQYEKDTREQDKAVPVTGPVFDADSVRRIKARIRAGQSARERDAEVR